MTYSTTSIGSVPYGSGGDALTTGLDYTVTGTVQITLTPTADYDPGWNHTGTISFTLTAPDTGVVEFTSEFPYLVMASVFIDDIDWSGSIHGEVTVTREDNAAATFEIIINSNGIPATFLNKEIKIAFQAANEFGIVADYIHIFVGVIKTVFYNDNEGSLTLTGFDYGGVHQTPGELLSSDITVVLTGSVYINAAGTFASGFAPIWGVTYLGSDDIEDGRDYFVDSLNGEIVVPITSNFIDFPGGLEFKYAQTFDSLKNMLEAIAALKSWDLEEDGITLEDYSVKAKQPILSITDESMIDLIRKFLELNGAKCEANLFPKLRLYSETTNLIGSDDHIINESKIYDDSLNFTVNLSDLITEQTVRSVAKNFANIEISASTELASESGTRAFELVADITGWNISVGTLDEKVVVTVTIPKSNIASISHTAGGTFTFFGTVTNIEDSDWIQSIDGENIVFSLTIAPSVLWLFFRVIVGFPIIAWTLVINGTTIDYGGGTIEATVEVTGTRSVTGVSPELVGDVYESPYIETAAHAGNCANAILTERGNVYEMNCEIPLHEASTMNIGDKINVEKNGSTIFKGIIKLLEYSINTESANSQVVIMAKGVGINI